MQGIRGEDALSKLEEPVDNFLNNKHAKPVRFCVHYIIFKFFQNMIISNAVSSAWYTVERTKLHAYIDALRGAGKIGSLWWTSSLGTR